MLIVIDSYDSFTFNLYQMLGALHPRVEVVRNDKTTVEAIRTASFDGIVLSPGPGTPDDAGICIDVVRELAGTLPILGVCLGHQTICQVAGASIVRAAEPVHGKASPVRHEGKGILDGLPSPFAAGRYHSLVVDPPSLPDELEVTARSETGEIMAVQHRAQQTYGVQFHPESILTPDGQRLLSNFLHVVEEAKAC